MISGSGELEPEISCSVYIETLDNPDSGKWFVSIYVDGWNISNCENIVVIIYLILPALTVINVQQTLYNLGTEMF